jgi:N-acetylmuramoyl-L-alanine amidase
MRHGGRLVRGLRLIVLALAVLGGVAAVAGPEPARARPAVVVSDARVGLHSAVTRFVLDLSEDVSFDLFTLADPYRVVIDLPEIKWELSAAALPARKGLFRGLRFGLFRPGTSRLVLDCNDPVAVNEAFIMKPLNDKGYRLVVDLVATSRNAFLSTIHGAKRPPVASRRTASPPTASPQAARSRAVSPPPSLTFAPPPPRPRSSPVQRVIVIDPGHGGVDPGAIGVSGIYEKNITLAAARDLRNELLRLGGYRVILTRNRDKFIRLRDRVAFGRNADADLFVSLHADTMPNRKVRGASVYTLSETASDAEAAALAVQENKADLIAGVDLTHETSEVANILIDLAQRETMNRSARFAALLVDELRRETRLLRNTHRFAGFAVLKAPDVPSVLVELGFLSNRRDEKTLRTKAYRRKLAAAIARGIDRYLVGVEEALRK